MRFVMTGCRCIDGSYFYCFLSQRSGGIWEISWFYFQLHHHHQHQQHYLFVFLKRSQSGYCTTGSLYCLLPGEALIKPDNWPWCWYQPFDSFQHAIVFIATLSVIAPNIHSINLTTLEHCIVLVHKGSNLKKIQNSVSQTERDPPWMTLTHTYFLSGSLCLRF